MNVLNNLDTFSRKALQLIADEHGKGSFSTAQKLSFLVGLCGVSVINATGQHQLDMINHTFTLIYTDPASRRSNYQTVCVPDYALDTPFVLQLLGGTRARLFYRPKFDTFNGINLNDGFEVRLHAMIFAASNHYYSRVAPDLSELPTAMLISPYSTCAEGCKMCSRGSAGTFAKPSQAYVWEHVDQVLADYRQRGWEPTDLWSANLVTGCQPNPDRELKMMLDVMKEYRRQGFNNVRFQVYSYHLRQADQMRALLDAGAMGYIGTIETFDDQRRLEFWGSAKGSQTFALHRTRYALAHELRFPIVETNYVIGTDSYETLKKGIATLDDEKVAVVPNIMRNYNSKQLDALHPDLWTMGFRYVLDAFETAVATYHHPTIKRFAGSKAVEYLNARGWNITFDDLPIRHT